MNHRIANATENSSGNDYVTGILEKIYKALSDQKKIYN